MQSPRRSLSTTGGSKRSAALAALLLTAAGAVVCSDALALWVRPVEDPAPSILEAVTEEPGLNNVALTADGSKAAASVVQQLKERRFRSTIRFYVPGSDEPSEITLPGEVRDLLFAPGGESLFALIHIPAKKRPGDVDLVRIDTSSPKTRRRLRMPPSALGLAYWSAGNALLIVCAHEIRSVLLPDLRSGPLYRLIGVNTSATVLDGARLLVGREDGLSLIDFLDPPGENEMPVRMRIDSDRPVLQLVANRDGSEILVRLLDGGIATVDLVSRTLVPDVGDGLLPTRPWPPRESVPGLPPELEPERSGPAETPTLAASPTPPEAETQVTPTPETETIIAGEQVAAAAEVPSTTTAVQAPSSPEPSAATAAPTKDVEELTTPPAQAPPRQVPPDDGGSPPQVTGKLDGPGAKSVSSVVLFGPDNILREATRVTPDAEGRWQVAGLAPGRYRIQLAGDGDRVPVADPPFRVVEIAADRPAVEASFQVLESR